QNYLENNFRIGNLIVKPDFKAMILCMLLITTLLSTSNIYQTSFAGDGIKNGCANTVKVTLSNLPNQTASASSEVILKNIDPNNDRGQANLNISGIGSGIVIVDFHHDTNDFLVAVEGVPGQTGKSTSFLFIDKHSCFSSGDSLQGFIDLSGVGSGSVELTKIN
ncbi:MAG: hypothetical protein ACTHJ2_02795, partial [Candidatus Nitrosocosmicus sp.]